jgi:hypothetical protein
MCLQGKMLSHYFITTQYTNVGLNASFQEFMHVNTVSMQSPTPNPHLSGEMVMLRKQYTLILKKLYINDQFCAVKSHERGSNSH